MIDPTLPRRIKNFRGIVTKGVFGKGSKSEHQAIYLDPDGGGERFVLRRKTGPPHGDAALRKLVGQQVECDGFISGYTILAERIEPVK